MWSASTLGTSQGVYGQPLGHLPPPQSYGAVPTPNYHQQAGILDTVPIPLASLSEFTAPERNEEGGSTASSQAWHDQINAQAYTIAEQQRAFAFQIQQRNELAEKHNALSAKAAQLHQTVEVQRAAMLRLERERNEAVE